MSVMLSLRVLSLAAAYGRVGSVFLIDDELKDWRISRDAASTIEDATAFAESLIKDLRPLVVVTEKYNEKSKKSEHTHEIIKAIASAAKANNVLSMPIERPREYKNKYQEAEALVRMYPELDPWLPEERKFHDREPMNTVLFEALALADAARKKGAIGLAAAMG